MQKTPVIAVHMTGALAAIAIGPIALWARQGQRARPRLHRAAGYAWVTLMVVTALSAIFIRDFRLPNLNGYTPIHLLVPATLAGLWMSFVKLFRGDIAGHRALMRQVYFGACIVAGAFTLLPGRYLGNLVWGEWLGLVSPTFQPPSGTPLLLAARAPGWVWPVLAAGLAVLALAWLRRGRLSAAAR